LGFRTGHRLQGSSIAFRETMSCEVDATGVWIEYLVLPYLNPPAIVIREYR
jgi:hypothetical protein